MKRIAWILLALLLTGCAAEPIPQPLPQTEPREEITLPTVPETTLPPLSPEEELLQSMTLREQVGQLFFVRPDALDPSLTLAQIDDPGTPGVTALTEEIQLALESYPVGGFVQFSKNIQDPEQLLRFNRELDNSLRISPVIAVDEEGGVVARLANHSAFDLPQYPSAGYVGSHGGPEGAREMGLTIGGYLRNYGFNMDFAPVADVNTNPRNPIIGTRAFAPEPENAARCASAMAEGLKASGIAPVYKHFPGHGDTAEDSHAGIAVSHKTIDQMEACEFIPFLEAGPGDCIMVGHIALPEVTGDMTPATLSYPAVTGLLRQHLGFKGLIITDSLTMGAITQGRSSAQAALDALNAGCDILLMPQSLPEAFDAVLAAVEDGSFPRYRLEDTVLRILRFKLDRGILEP